MPIRKNLSDFEFKDPECRDPYGQTLPKSWKPVAIGEITGEQNFAVAKTRGSPVLRYQCEYDPGIQIER